MTTHMTLHRGHKRTAELCKYFRCSLLRAHPTIHRTPRRLSFHIYSSSGKCSVCCFPLANTASTAPSVPAPSPMPPSTLPGKAGLGPSSGQPLRGTAALWRHCSGHFLCAIFCAPLQRLTLCPVGPRCPVSPRAAVFLPWQLRRASCARLAPGRPG